MEGLFSEEFFVIPALAIAVFVISYLNVDRVLGFLVRQSQKTQNEIFDLMEKMLMEFERPKISRQLWLLTLGLGALGFLLLWPDVVGGLVIGGLLGLMGWTFPRSFLQRMWEKRCNLVVDQMVDGMTIMANGIKAGLSVTQAMERVVENVPGALAQEFQLVLGKIRLGMSIEDALNEFGMRIPRPDVQMFVTSVNILKETGGNLAETFATITTTIRERQKLEKKIEAMVAQGMMQGRILTAAPFVVAGIFWVLSPEYIMPLFVQPLGWIFLLIIVALVITGGIAIKKVVTIKV